MGDEFCDTSSQFEKCSNQCLVTTLLLSSGVYIYIYIYNAENNFHSYTKTSLPEDLQAIMCQYKHPLGLKMF